MANIVPLVVLVSTLSGGNNVKVEQKYTEKYRLKPKNTSFNLKVGYGNSEFNNENLMKHYSEVSDFKAKGYKPKIDLHSLSLLAGFSKNYNLVAGLNTEIGSGIVLDGSTNNFKDLNLISVGAYIDLALRYDFGLVNLGIYGRGKTFATVMYHKFKDEKIKGIGYTLGFEGGPSIGLGENFECDFGIGPREDTLFVSYTNRRENNNNSSLLSKSKIFKKKYFKNKDKRKVLSATCGLKLKF